MLQPRPVYLAALLTLAPAGCSTPAAGRESSTPSADAEPRAAKAPEFSNTSRAGSYLVSWRSIDGPVPLNETFQLDVRLQRAEDRTPVTGAEVFVHASMPEHDHGMLRDPLAHEVEPGLYRVEGMLLHMAGYWQIFVDVIEEGVAETTDFELTLE